VITRVYILYTGGTIGMAPKDETDPYSPLEPKPLEDLLKYIPGGSYNSETKFRSMDAQRLAEKGGRFIELDNGNVIEFGFGSLTPIDSSSITPNHWAEMAKSIEKVYSEWDGFVILHGTDTMAFTSSALSFMFENLAKPVVISGSQLPISQTRTDAVQNFINAIHIAGYKATDLPLIPEVVIVFADRIVRGCRASKVNAADWAGFNSPNFPLLGTIGEHIVVNTNYVLRPPAGNKKFFVKSDMVENVFNINLFPGFTGTQNALMKKLFLDDQVDGIVMRTYGAGNAPDESAFLETIRESVKKGKLIVNVTQCAVGTVEMGLYEASSELLEAGVLSGLDMTPEAALTKLMWTLGTQFGDGRINQVQISQRGEQTENLFDLRFGAVEPANATPTYTNAVSPDGRLDRNRISRAMLRISGLGVVGVQHGDVVQVRAFMNMPSARQDTAASEERCVAVIEFAYDEAKPEQTRMKNITYKTENVIGSGDVILTLIAEKKVPGEVQGEPVKMFFKGLYIAVYAKS
jgi:L-asparaginase